MKKDQVFTPRPDEIITKTGKIEEMMDKYITETIYRTWVEEFADNETGEVVEVERKEVIVSAGALVDDDIAARIAFHIAAGDIAQVEVSNVQREGVLGVGCFTLWAVTADTKGKPFKVILYALSAQMAHDIAADYISQNVKGWFTIRSISQMKRTPIMITDSYCTTYKIEERSYYVIDVRVSENTNEEPILRSFVLETKNVDTGVEAIKLYINTRAMEEAINTNAIVREYRTEVVEGALLKCTAIVPRSFSEAYLNYKK